MTEADMLGDALRRAGQPTRSPTPPSRPADQEISTLLESFVERAARLPREPIYRLRQKQVTSELRSGRWNKQVERTRAIQDEFIDLGVAWCLPFGGPKTLGAYKGSGSIPARPGVTVERILAVEDASRLHTGMRWDGRAVVAYGDVPRHTVADTSLADWAAGSLGSIDLTQPRGTLMWFAGLQDTNRPSARALANANSIETIDLVEDARDATRSKVGQYLADAMASWLLANGIRE